MKTCTYVIFGYKNFNEEEIVYNICLNVLSDKHVNVTTIKTHNVQDQVSHNNFTKTHMKKIKSQILFLSIHAITCFVHHVYQSGS